MRLNGNVAAVTGSGKGIGRSIALRLAREGANVIVTDVDLALAEETASAISELGQNAHALAVDVTHRRQVERISTAAEEVFDSPIGIVCSTSMHAARSSECRWRRRP
jgi:meso-butanediol dehydrogenase/(S,S)-butanediol dehydrogenase/diacetyl reductase